MQVSTKSGVRLGRRPSGASSVGLDLRGTILKEGLNLRPSVYSPAMLASCGEVFLDVREVRWWNRHREDAVALGERVRSAIQPNTPDAEMKEGLGEGFTCGSLEAWKYGRER